MGLSHTVSEIDGDFRRISQNFPTPLYFTPPLKGFPWNWVSAHGVRKLEGRATGLRKRFDDVFSSLDTIHQRDGQKDKRTNGHRATAKTALTHRVAL